MSLELVALKKRLAELEPDPGRVEPWPPTKPGDLCTIAYNELKAEGVAMPADRPENVLNFLLEQMALKIWANTVVDNDDNRCQPEGFRG